MTKLSKTIMMILMFILTVQLNACDLTKDVSESKLEFSFNTSYPADSNDEKFIYVNSDIDKIDLDCELKIDCGDAVVEVVDNSINEIIWNKDYNKDSNFKIELTDLKKENQYSIKISTYQSKKVNLKITSKRKLINDKEKPDKCSKSFDLCWN